MKILTILLIFLCTGLSASPLSDIADQIMTNLGRPLAEIDGAYVWYNSTHILALQYNKANKLVYIMFMRLEDADLTAKEVAYFLSDKGDWTLTKMGDKTDVYRAEGMIGIYSKESKRLYLFNTADVVEALDTLS